MEAIRRVNRSREQAKISYNQLSKWYDFFGVIEKKFRDAGLVMLGISEGEKVLEVGFGTGYCTASLAGAVGDSGKVYGIDISEGMLNATSLRLAKSGLSERVELRCGDALNLPYPSNFFDAVYISFALELFDTPDIPIVLQQFRRVLKNDGRICVVAMSKEGKTGLMVKLYDWAHKNFPKYIDCRPIYVKQELQNSNFEVTNANRMSMLNVPVAIILAKKITS
jgi:demethylmenaquinone methyltransferase/2-methoxy-6-polyprenyl-1,4-benzoquinol methylase